MSDQSVRPEECPPGRHYTGIVRTNSGTHGRILQRSSGYWDRPWLYYREENSTPSFAADGDVSDLQEIDPFVHHHLKEVKSEKRRVQMELQGVRHELERATVHLNYQAELREGSILPLTEDRVRELAREEINKTSWQLHGLTITHKEQQ